MKESTKNIQYFKLIIKEVIMYELILALLVKMQNELAFHLKRQRCENCIENTKCWTVCHKVNFNFNYPRADKSVKILDMSLRLKKVCPVY